MRDANTSASSSKCVVKKMVRPARLELTWYMVTHDTHTHHTRTQWVSIHVAKPIARRGRHASVQHPTCGGVQQGPCP